MLTGDSIVLYGNATVLGIHNQDIMVAIEGEEKPNIRCWTLPQNHEAIIRESKTYPEPTTTKFA